MNISLLEPIGVSEERIGELSRQFMEAGHHFTYYSEKTTDVEELKKRTEGQDIVMIANNPYPAEVIEAAGCLKMIAVAFTGIDHVGLEACRQKQISVCNCAGYSSQSVAELVIGMAIDVLRFIKQADGAARDQKTSAGLTGSEICGKTVGIVGCGQIGLQTARLFRAFGASVLAYSRHEREEWKAEGIQYAGLEKLLKQSDIVSIHLPLNETTKGLIGRNEIAGMKRGSILINCARGPVVDNVALAEALNHDIIGGAAVDVFDMEPPLPKDYPLCQAKNTLLTPHVAFLTKEAMERRAVIEFNNVSAYLKNEPENLCQY